MSYYSLHCKAPARNSRGQANWWGTIATGTQRELERRPYQTFDGPVKIDAKFKLARPEARKRDTHHVTTPDFTVLISALTGIGDGKLINDAKQVTELHFSKSYGDGYDTGADVEVTSL